MERQTFCIVGDLYPGMQRSYNWTAGLIHPHSIFNGCFTPRPAFSASGSLPVEAVVHRRASALPAASQFDRYHASKFDLGSEHFVPTYLCGWFRVVYRLPHHLWQLGNLWLQLASTITSHRKTHPVAFALFRKWPGRPAAMKKHNAKVVYAALGPEKQYFLRSAFAFGASTTRGKQDSVAPEHVRSGARGRHRVGHTWNRTRWHRSARRRPVVPGPEWIGWADGPDSTPKQVPSCGSRCPGSPQPCGTQL